ncbi:gliding motility lipoprotein GldB [Cesiribacter sp. SM1]|uniref:gliding motility lipoprotein GldB n=1 Tax=Cesiribacter sp. SM1 TaxID=2861196 RepID=UPI001CD62EAB|nr:gliding motility lipoprotein GldB [Cesiribacter sp. SM1]
MSFSYNNQLTFIYRLLILFPLCLLLFSCGNNADDAIDRPDVSDIEVEVSIHRLEQPLFEAKSRDEIKAFLEENELFAQNFLRINEYPNDSVIVDQLWQLSQDPHLDTVYRESQQIFPDLKAWEEQFETAFKYIKFYYPEFQPPVIYTVVSGFSTDLFMTEDMIVIGLDYFLGPTATYRPQELPQYILHRYAPEYVVPGAMLLLSSRFNQTDLRDKSMLAEMIYYGKSYYFVDFVLPSAADSVILGYTTEELQGVNQNKGTIWNHFLKNELLFETNHVLKKKYLEERPKTLEIGDKAPGRIGNWLGWQIVRAFMEKKDDLSLRQLMELPDARYIFNEAKYRPENER